MADRLWFGKALCPGLYALSGIQIGGPPLHYPARTITQAPNSPLVLEQPFLPLPGYSLGYILQSLFSSTLILLGQGVARAVSRVKDAATPDSMGVVRVTILFFISKRILSEDKARACACAHM